MAAWTWDAGHFTLDAGPSHTMDGYHDDTADAPSGGGGTSGQAMRAHVMRLRHEDDWLLQMIRAFLRDRA